MIYIERESADSDHLEAGGEGWAGAGEGESCSRSRFGDRFLYDLQVVWMADGEVT